MHALQHWTTTNGANGKKYRSDYRAILNWVVDKVKKDNLNIKDFTVEEWLNE